MLRRLVMSVYNGFIRPIMPRKIAALNGVPVREVRLFDHTDELLDYEAALVGAIRHNVDTGDRVIVVGAGRGVSSVVSAQRTGPTGEVIAYDGSRERVEQARETVRLGRMDAIVQVKHAIVGTNVGVVGETGDAGVVDGDELPESDVMVLDCEGAELDILETMTCRPDVLIVETHAFLDSPEAAVRELLDERGYDVAERGVEEESLGVFILTAVQKPS